MCAGCVVLNLLLVQAQAEDLQNYLSMPHQMAGPHGFPESPVQEAGAIP